MPIWKIRIGKYKGKKAVFFEIWDGSRLESTSINPIWAKAIPGWMFDQINLENN